MQTYYPMKRKLPAFLAAIETYKENLPNTIVGQTHPIGEISFCEHLVDAHNRKVFVRFFTPDFSKHSFMENVFIDEKCRPGVGLPGFFNMDSPKWLDTYPMSLVPNSLDQDVVVFSRPYDLPECSPVRVSFWALDEDHVSFVQKKIFNIIAFSGKDAFVKYMQAMANSYKQNLEKTAIGEIASAIACLKRAAEAKAKIETINLDEIAALTRLKVDIVGI